MKKFLSLALSALLVFSSTSAYAQEISEKNQNTAELIVSDYGVNSLQYSIIDNGEIVVSGQKGNKEKLDKNTMYGIGSVSKVYATAAVLKLADEGKVNIDEPLINYISDFKMADPRYKDITPRMLMNHSSGIYGTVFKNAMLFEKNDKFNHDNILKYLESQTLKYDPGAFSEYCNDGFTLLEILTERVSGENFTEYITKNFLEPLGLTHTKTPMSDFDRGLLAKGYFPLNQMTLPIESANVIGAGGIYSTAEELVKYSQIFMDKGTDILSKESVEAMTNKEYLNGMWPDYTGDNFFNFGLGWDNVSVEPYAAQGIQALFKGGDTMQYHAALMVLPAHNISVAVLSSEGSSIFNQLFAKNILNDYLIEKGIMTEPVEEIFTIPVKADMPEGLNDFAGTYATSGGESIEISFKDGELNLPVLVGLIDSQKYIYTESGSFVSQDGKNTIKFVKEVDGNTYLQADLYLEIPELGSAYLKSYAYQKIEKNPISDEIKSVWEERNNTNYYLADDKYSSEQYYYPGISAINLSVDTDLGYAYAACKIIDENNAKNVLSFRDVVDLNFVKGIDGNEILKIQGFTFVSEKSMSDLWAGSLSHTTIQPDGLARWFNLPEDLAGKTIEVELPEKSSFAIYDDETGMCTFMSIVDNKNTTSLPKSGKIVFIGSQGDKFDIVVK